MQESVNACPHLAIPYLCFLLLFLLPRKMVETTGADCTVAGYKEFLSATTGHMSLDSLAGHIPVPDTTRRAFIASWSYKFLLGFLNFSSNREQVLERVNISLSFIDSSQCFVSDHTSFLENREHLDDAVLNSSLLSLSAENEVLI